MKNIDCFNEIDEELEKILLKMNLNPNKKFNFEFLNENIIKLKLNIENKGIIYDKNNYQELLRMQEDLFNKNISLVGIDISRTIIEYTSNIETQKNAVKILKTK